MTDNNERIEYKEKENTEEFRRFNLGLKTGVGLQMPLDEKLSIFTGVQLGSNITNMGANGLGSYANFFGTWDISASAGIIYAIDYIVKPMAKQENQFLNGKAYLEN